MPMVTGCGLAFGKCLPQCYPLCPNVSNDCSGRLLPFVFYRGYPKLAKVGNGVVRGKTTHHVLLGTLYNADWRTVYTPSNDARYTVGFLSHASPHDDVPLPIEG